MWLYLPKSILESPLPPDPAGLSLEFRLPCRDTELFAGASGTHTPRPLSWRGWKTRPWIRRLSGLTLPPLTAAPGAKKWIWSLPDTPASRSAPPAHAGDFAAWESWLAAWPDLQPAMAGSHDGLAFKMDRYRLAGNGVCPLAAAYAFCSLLLHAEGDG